MGSELIGEFLSDLVLSDEERQFLQGLIDSNQKTLKVHFGIQGIVYVSHESIIHEKGFEYFDEFLQGLERKGFLRKNDKVYNIFCPNCNFPNVYSRYSCPTCHTTHVTRIQLVQHPFCGHIGRKSQFQGESGLRCPSCKTDLIDEQTTSEKSSYKTIGTSLECENGHRFVNPEISHLCSRCEAKFSHKESNYRAIYNYELTQKALDLIGNEIDTEAALAKVQELLENRGYSTAKNDKMVGFSSSTHEFSLTGKKDSQVMLFDVAILGGNDELTKLLGKKIDIENSTATFLDSKGNKALVSLGQVYGINIVDLTEENWVLNVDNLLTELAANDTKKLFDRLR